MRRKLAIDPRQIEHRCNRAPGDRPAPPLQGRTNKTAALDPAPTAPSSPTPAADRVNSGNHCSRQPSTDFCNKIGAKRSFANTNFS
jgi:hypothetical protein